MEVTPRSNNLYRQIAKDYTPKQAEMNICKYIQQMEDRLTERIEDLEEQLKLKQEPVEETKPRRGRAKAANPELVESEEVYPLNQATEIE